MGGGSKSRARPKVECIPKKEAVILARQEHATNGHWGRDLIKMQLTDKYHSPKLNESIKTAIVECARCKNFGPAYINILLEPITRRHPYELLVGDYLTMPKGKGGYHTIGLYLDVFAQHAWGFKYSTKGSGKTTASALNGIYSKYLPCKSS